MRTTRRLAAALVLILATLLPGSGRAATEIVLWHAYRGQELAALEKATRLFAERSGGRYVVRTVATPYDSFADKISAGIPNGSGPDLFISAHDRLGGWVEAGGLLEPLDFFIDAEIRERFIPRLWPALEARGQTFGLPFKYALISMIYDRRRVPVPPETMEQLVAWARAEMERTGGRFAWAYQYDSPFMHSALMNAFGAELFDAEARGGLVPPRLATAPMIAAAEQLVRWVRIEGVLPADPDGALVTGLFNSGQAGIIFTGPWFFAEVDPARDVGIAPLPRLDAAGGSALQPWMTVEGLFISARSPRTDAAWDLARFLTSTEVARIMAVEGRQLPANAAVYEDPVITADPMIAGFRAQAESAAPAPNGAVMTLLWAPFETSLRRMVKGAAHPSDALADLEARINADVAAMRRTR